MNFETKGLSKARLIDLYKALLNPRLIEERMLILLRQGKISKWFSAYGQEAISVGCAEAMKKDEYILTMHRNLGVFTCRNVPLDRLFAQFQGKMEGFSKGRERSFHFGTKEHKIIGMISHLGPQLAVAGGIGLGEKLDRSKRATLVFTGEGGTSEGDFHEALNVASVWQLPVIFLIENNGYGLSTPTYEQFSFDSFLQKGPSYGMDAVQIDGNNILEVFHTVRKIASSIRKDPKPWIIEARTFRMRGHEEASGIKYVPKELLRKWAKKDPVVSFENFLKGEKLLDSEKIEKIKTDIKAEIETGLKKAFSYSEVVPDTKNEMQDVYTPFKQEIRSPKTKKTSKKRLVDAISDGLKEALEIHEDLVVMGQDIAEYGGVFKVTEGFLKKFGRDRIRNTPICESAILGMGLGLSIKDHRSVIEMQFADFVSSGFNQVVNNLAKTYWRWGQNANVVVRMPTGAGVGAGPFHSQSNEAWFFHTPGLKVVYPSTPYYAKGLLHSSIEDPGPVMFFEHKALYRAIEEEIPNESYSIELGKGRVVQEGSELSVITYGAGVHWAQKLLKEYPSRSIELIDLVTLLPWDKELVGTSVKKTGRILILHEDTLTGGIGAEISAWVSENCFEALDAPVFRVASLDTPVPFALSLERNFLPVSRLKSKLEELLEF
jgi:2-oxoisovalerate dehydrogenase E1 component